MNDICIQWGDDLDLDHNGLVSLLRVFGDLLPDPLSGRMELNSYAVKLIKNADIAVAFIQEEAVGLLVLYSNDVTSRRAHLPIISILPSCQGRGIGKVLMTRAVARARQRGMQEINLEVDGDNYPAQQLYRSLGFHFAYSPSEKRNMIYDIPRLSSTEFPTPIQEHPRLLSELDLDIDLRIKRDDLYPMSGGGIKARKIKYIMRDLIKDECDVLVTNGGPQSNHARASAVLCAQLGIKCHLVIVLESGMQYLDSGNILLMRLSGATIEFCTKEQLSTRMNSAMELYEQQGHKPRYVWGGGHCVAGIEAFVHAAAEAQAQQGEWMPEFMVAASATGSTQAGFAIGFANTPTQVIGISAARGAIRGGQIVRDCVTEYFQSISHKGLSADMVKIDFRDEWTDGGYEKTSPELLEVVHLAARAGIFVDTTYSGKALRGLVDLVKAGEIPHGSRVLFWHTGGLMNLQASPFAGGMVSL